MEKEVTARARGVGADCTVIRAGTLKGGASGSANAEDGGGGEPSFLNPEFYTLGNQARAAAGHAGLDMLETRSDEI